MKKSLFENNSLTYREENGRLYPNLELPEQTNHTIGKYGLLHLDFIKEHRKGRYTTLLSEYRLNEYLYAQYFYICENVIKILFSLTFLFYQIFPT